MVYYCPLMCINKKGKRTISLFSSLVAIAVLGQKGTFSLQVPSSVSLPRQREDTMSACSMKDQKCVPCEGLDASAVLSLELVTQRLETSLPLWSLQPIPGSDNQLISKSFVAKNFQAALDAINAMGAIAESQGHHPDFHLTSYRNVRIDLFTHSLQGITENDLVLAELFDQVPVEYSPKWLKEHPAAANKSS